MFKILVKTSDVEISLLNESKFSVKKSVACTYTLIDVMSTNAKYPKLSEKKLRAKIEKLVTAK